MLSEQLNLLVVTLEVLTWLLPLVAASITALGVWFGPQLVENRRKRREIEERTKRQILELESPFLELNEEEIEKDWLAIGNGAIKPLKLGLKTAKYARTIRTIVRALYRLGDEEVKKALLSRYEGILKSSKDSDEIRDTLDEIKYLKIVELAPQLFDRLKRGNQIEKYEMIRTLDELEYGPALPYLIDLAVEHLKEGKPGDLILHFCVAALGDIAPRWDDLTNDEFDLIIDVFTKALNIEDRGLIDGVVRCYLPQILKCKYELREPSKTCLIETLAKLLEHKDGDISEQAVERLIQLGDKKVVPYLKKRLDKEKNFNTTLKSRLEWSLKVLKQ